MKALKRIGIFLGPAVVALLLGGSTYDYGLQCTKCLHYKHVVLQRCFGIPFYRSSSEHANRGDYEKVFGHSCQHIFRKDGFGRSSYSLLGSGGGCGSTAEGTFLRYRTRAVSTTYELVKRVGEKQLARETFAVIDRIMPPETRSSPGAMIPSELVSLSIYLDSVQSREDWLEVLRCAVNNFRESPDLSKP